MREHLDVVARQLNSAESVLARPTPRQPRRFAVGSTVHRIADYAAQYAADHADDETCPCCNRKASAIVRELSR